MIGIEVKKPEYDFPYLELKSIVSSFEGRFLDESTKREFEYAINDFRWRVFAELQANPDDFDKFELLYSLESGFVKCKNLYTACILYSRYIPFSFLEKDQKDIVFKDSSKIEYSLDLQEYIYC